MYASERLRGACMCDMRYDIVIVCHTDTQRGVGGFRRGRPQKCMRICIYVNVHVNVYIRRGTDGGDRGGRQQSQCGQPGGRARGNASLGR